MKEFRTFFTFSLIVFHRWDTRYGSYYELGSVDASFYERTRCYRSMEFVIVCRIFPFIHQPTANEQRLKERYSPRLKQNRLNGINMAASTVVK